MTTIKIRRGLSGTGSGKWGTNNPTLADGEFGLETDTGKLKIGDSTTAWNSLLYITDGSKITGNTLASNVVSSSLTSVGTLTNLTVTNTINGSVSGSAGSATTATTAGKATNIAGGGGGVKLPIQSAADTTIFSNVPSTAGQTLFSNPSSPYVNWGYPVPYAIQTGIILASEFSSGIATKSFPTAFTSGVTPVVVLTPVSSTMTVIHSATLSSAPNNTQFIVRLRSISNGSSTIAADASPTDVHWIAIQYSSTSGPS
jgi:hypothetical protein